MQTEAVPVMNIARVLELADVIENDGLAAKDIGFDMRWFIVRRGILERLLADGNLSGGLPHHTCGTSCCIAGMAYVLWPNDENNSDPEFSAQLALGLTDSQAHCLFYDFTLTKETAAAKLRDMAKAEYERFSR